MKILDAGNAGSRLKVFLLWSVLLFAVQYGSAYLIEPTLGASGTFLEVGISILFAGFAGYMTAGALKNKTGDKRPSTIYGAVVPVFAAALGWIVNLATGVPVNIQLPWLAMLAGLIGGYISQRKII